MKIAALQMVSGIQLQANLAQARQLMEQAASLVQETRHLRGHAAKAGRCPDDDCVVCGQFGDGCDRCRLIQFEIGALGDVLRDRLRDTLDIDAGTRRARAFRNCLGHGFNVTVGRVIENEDFRHGVSPK
mgnify:CR=1 FL=1